MFVEKQIILFCVWSLSLSERFIHFSFCIDVMKKWVNGFPLFSRDPDGRSISNFYKLSLSVYVYGGLHKVLTLPANVWLAKINSVMFLYDHFPNLS